MDLKKALSLYEQSAKAGYEGAKAKVTARVYLWRMEQCKDANFGNGRNVRSFFEKVFERQVMRVERLGIVSDEERFTIEAEDIYP